MTRTTLQPVAMLMASCLPVLTACAEQAPTAAAVPVAEMSVAGGPSNGDGWIALGSTHERPALSLYENRRPVLVLTCDGIQTRVQTRGFEPKQAWPQPVMVIRFGDASRSASPDVRNIGSQVAYEVDFPIADDVIGAIRNAAPLVVDFNDQSKALKPIPANLAGEFTDRCEALVPAGMRQVGTKSAG